MAQSLSDANFVKFVRDCDVMDNVLTFTQVDLILNQCMKDASGMISPVYSKYPDG